MSERDRLVHLVTEQVMNSAEIGRFCDRYAREHSGTVFWSEQDFEDNERTAQYELYWAVYSRVMGQIVIDAGNELFGRIREV